MRQRLVLGNTVIENAEKRAHYVVTAKGVSPEPNHIQKVADMYLFGPK